jgi:hypothetical protein
LGELHVEKLRLDRIGQDSIFWRYNRCEGMISLEWWMTSYEGKAGFFIDSILSDRHLLMYSNTCYVVVRIYYASSKILICHCVRAEWADKCSVAWLPPEWMPDLIVYTAMVRLPNFYWKHTEIISKRSIL